MLDIESCVVAPRISTLSDSAAVLNTIDLHRSHLCRLDAAPTYPNRVGAWQAYPRFRVLHRQTANAYAVMVVFSCLGL